MNGETAADAKMMTINQERFEDDPTPDTAASGNAS